MACTNCIQTTASITGFVPNNCQSTNPCFLDAGCVVYTGAALTCSGIATNDSLDTILQKISPLLCAATGDYSSYNTYCLAPISTQQQFVESISNFVCTLGNNFTVFTTSTFPAYQASVAASLSAINNPNITCASAGVISSDTLNQLLVKYCTKFVSIDTALDLSTVTWSSCYTVSPAPTTIAGGFNTLIGQICALKAAVAAAAVLPVFNNTGTCLASPGTADTLVATIGKIITRLCNTGTLNTSTLSWGCTTNGTSSNTDLQGALQSILTQITAVSQAEPMQWSADFVVTNVDNANHCLGKHIALATPINQDRFVAATAGDGSPGTLQSKLIAGSNITLDFSTPTQVTINSSGGAGVGDHKVIADASDTVPDYLISKLEGGTAAFGVSVVPFLDTSNTSHQVALNASVDPVALFTALLNALDSDSGLKALFCSQIQSCPSPCSAPSNVTVTYQSGTTTTSTTTTTTTTAP